MKKFLLLFAFCSLLSNTTMAQAPTNDECINAIELDDVTNWCSAVAEFSNTSATNSSQVRPSCFPDDGYRDVWFSFVAVATTANISVSGASGANAGGSLLNPQFAVYVGDCNTLTEVACNSDAFNVHVAESFVRPLSVGQRYFIRVSARNNQQGTFRLCVNNFNEVPAPDGDCEPGVVLCDKSPFTVESVSGVGRDAGEMDNTCTSVECNGAIQESGSSWYKWTCKDAGTLTFDVNPLNPSDDLDFVVYELPNGVDNCDGKFSLRCMFSGENVGEPLSNWINCTGATGLRAGDGDTQEDCGCQNNLNNNNYAEALQMEVGRAYALVVNNFSRSGQGFTINFGGTGTFLGPEPRLRMDPDKDCFGEGAEFEDLSTFSGGTIVRREWNFGQDATPSMSTDQTVSGVQWESPGLKNIILTVESERGCLVTIIEQVFIDSCCETLNQITASQQTTSNPCWYDTVGRVDVTSSSNADPSTFLWNTGATTEDIERLTAGTYSVTITNRAGCKTSLQTEVTTEPPIVPTFMIKKPTCGGGMDGELTVTAVGGVPPYTYSFDGDPFSNDNMITDLPVRNVNVRILDANDCLFDTTVFVNELVLEIDSLDRVITPPSCFGFSDGRVEVVIVNGQPPYRYDFQDGNGFTPNNIKTGLPDTTIIVEVRDANDCEGRFELRIRQPDSLSVAIVTDTVSCFRAADASARAIPAGGVGGYAYKWSNGGGDSLISGLDTGLYTVTLTDANGCLAFADARIVEPPRLEITDVQAEAVICFSDSNGIIRLQATGGSPSYVYYVEGGMPTSDTVISDLRPGPYLVFVEDMNGCKDSVQTRIESPPPLIIDAGNDQTVELGIEARLRTFLQPIGWPVSYNWSPTTGFLDCTDCDAPLVRAPRTTTYTLTVRDSSGCTSTDSVTIFVEIVRPVYIPNVFSPNEDGRNDFFTLFGGPAATRIDELVIFNRWGGRVYRVTDIPLNDPMMGWDGTFKQQLVDPGVFVYIASVRFLDDEVILYKGSITVVR